MIEREEKRFSIEWQGIPLEIRFIPSWSPSYLEIYGYPLSRLEIDAAKPLPISETGHMGQWERLDNIEAEGGPVAYVRAWLDHEAKSPAWLEQQAAARQLSFFD